MEQTLNIALKKEELCIAINRKAEDLPRLTQQDFRALAEHAAHVLRAERLGLPGDARATMGCEPTSSSENLSTLYESTTKWPTLPTNNSNAHNRSIVIVARPPRPRSRGRLQDALELLPELHRKMLPANRTFVMRQTSKTMCAAVENAKLDTVVVRRSGVKFPNGEGLQDKLNGLNAWCKVTVLYLNDCGLQERGAQAIADVLRVNTTLTNLNLGSNSLGEDGGQAIAAVLRVNTTLTEFDLSGNGVGEGAGQAIADVLRVNTTLTELDLRGISLGEGVKSAVRQSFFIRV